MSCFWFCVFDYCRHLGTHAGKSKKLQQQKEVTVDLAKFLYWADPEKIDFENVKNFTKIEQWERVLERKLIELPSPQVSIILYHINSVICSLITNQLHPLIATVSPTSYQMRRLGSVAK